MLVLRLEGELPEKPPVELPDFLSSTPPPVTVTGIWRALNNGRGRSAHQARSSCSREGLSAGWAKLQELRMDLEKFRKSGKPVFAYLRQPGTREYYVACRRRPHLSRARRSR